MNTMFAAVASRTAEIGTLRAIGFPPRAILVSFVAEALFLAAAGYLMGLALGVAAVVVVNYTMQGVTFAMPTFSTAVVALRLSPRIVGVAFLLALAMGAVGGFVPARTAARLRVVEALRRA
jgi:ABC-type antimicrobial peptide transport system permease subunit